MVTGILISVLAGLCLYELSGAAVPGGAAQGWHWHALVAAAIVAGAYIWAQSAAHARLRKALLRAREGLLEEVPPGVLRWTSAGRLTREYTRTIRALRGMFRTVEECQMRFLSERNKMNTLVQSLPGALLSLSDDLQVTIANIQAESLFGIPQERLVGANLFDLLRLGEQDRALLRDAFLYKQPLRNQEVRLETTQGVRHCSLNIAFYSAEDNDIGGVLILQDISEYRRLQDILNTQERLVAMGQLAAGVAHELNTPLGSIQGYAQLLGESVAPGSVEASHARVIADETKRCSRIVRDLLNFARTDRCDGEICEVNQLIREVIDAFLNCRTRRYRIDVRLQLPEHPLLVEGACGQLDIVLTNVILNAIQALDGVEQPRIVVSAAQEDAFAVIGIADNGPGVRPELRSRIFDPFFTSKEVGQGTGLGLPISHAILAKRGGQVQYDPDYRDGARFLIRLPSVDPRRAGLEAAAATERHPA